MMLSFVIVLQGRRLQCLMDMGCGKLAVVRGMTVDEANSGFQLMSRCAMKVYDPMRGLRRCWIWNTVRLVPP